MLKKYGDQRFIGASLRSATGGAPQNDRAFASLSIATQSVEYTTRTKTSPLKKPLPQVASRSAHGLVAAISSADLPAVFSFCTRSLLDLFAKTRDGFEGVQRRGPVKGAGKFRVHRRPFQGTPVC
jgi:hypothetical protein